MQDLSVCSPACNCMKCNPHKAIHAAVVQARAAGFEARLEQQHVREMAIPHITRRLMQTHLGQQYYVHRIEVTIMGVQFHLTGNEYRDGCKPGLKMQLEHTLNRIKEHLRNGGCLNLQYWSEVR